MRITKKSKKAYYRAINMILWIYNTAGFTVMKINCNNKYITIVHQVMDNLDIEMNYVNIQEHESVAEWNIHTIKERMQMMYHHLPYKCLPKLIIKYMCYNAVTKLNFFSKIWNFDIL